MFISLEMCRRLPTCLQWDLRPGPCGLALDDPWSLHPVVYIIKIQGSPWVKSHIGGLYRNLYTHDIWSPMAWNAHTTYFSV